MMLRKFAAMAAVSLLASVSAQAACDIHPPMPIKIMTASFPAWKAVTTAMAECGNLQVEFDMLYRDKQPAALAAKPALYNIAGTAPNNLVPLLNDGLVRPLDDLVAKFGQQLTPNQLVRIDGKVMAIAMMVNTQHFMYREDVLKSLNIPVPKTYDDILAAAAAMRKANAVQYPFAGSWKAGWDLAMEFINLFPAYGGSFVGAGNVPTINNATGLKTLATLKALTEYMDPEYLTADAASVAKQFQQGKVAMSNFWASRAGAMDDPKESTVVGKVIMAAAPAAVAGGKPATTLFWDGFAIAKNIPDQEAEYAFRVALKGIDAEMVKANNATAVWLIKEYQPSRLSEGAIASAEQGAPSYQATTAMGLMHSALGTGMADFFTGRKTAEQTLASIEAAYTTAARERGIMK